MASHPAVLKLEPPSIRGQRLGGRWRRGNAHIGERKVMPFQPVEDTAEAVMRFAVGGADPDVAKWVVQETHHWRRAAGWTSFALDALGDEIVAWWQAELKPDEGGDYRFYDLDIRDIGAEFGLQNYRVVNETGTNATHLDPVPVIAAVVNWVCDPGEPPRRGTTYYGRLDEDDIDENTVVVATRNILNTAYDALRAVDVSASAALVIPSRYSGFTLVERANGTVFKKPTPRDPALTNTVASVSTRVRVGKQSKRR